MAVAVLEVTVIQVPATRTARQRQTFLRSLVSELGDRPSLVLDCSQLRLVDWSASYLLLCCLEEALKRNGDARLAALPPGAEKMLAETGLDRLFDALPTTAAAVRSFDRPRTSRFPAARAQVRLHEELQSAG